MTEQVIFGHGAPAQPSGGGEQFPLDSIDAYLHTTRPDDEPIITTVQGLLDGAEIDPSAWERPGIKALTVAAAEWTLQDPARQSTAHNFVVEMLQTENPDDHATTISRARDLNDEQLADVARVWFVSDDPVLSAGRRRLEKTVETERPFEIIAINLDSGMYSGENQAAWAAWSAALTGNERDRVPSVFVYKSGTDAPPIMVLDRGTIDALNNPQNQNHRRALEAVTHEYGHTQRDIMTTPTIGLSLEERMAIIVAGGQTSYPETWVYETVLDCVTDQQYGQKFLEAIAGRATMDEVYGIVTSAAGPQATLALAGIQPQSGTDHYALPAYAEAFMQPDETRAAAVYRNLTEAIDPATLIAGLETLSSPQAKHFMLIASKLGINLSSSAIEALIGRLAPKDNPQHFRDQFSKK